MLMIILFQVKHNLSHMCLNQYGCLACELSPLSYSSCGFVPLRDLGCLERVSLPLSIISVMDFAP